MQLADGNTNPSLSHLGNGNLASRLMSNPSASMDGGHRVPLWSEFFQHILSVKQRIGDLSVGVVEAYKFMTLHNANEGEPNVLTTRFLSEAGLILAKVNEISSRPSLNGYAGPARNAQEAQDIVLFSAETTELFTSFLSNNTLTISRLQEIYTQISLSVNNAYLNALEA